MSNFDLSIFELRYNDVHCHSLKLYPFPSSKIILVSQNLEYCSRKVTHFLKHLTRIVKIIPSSLKFSSLCRENKAINYTLIAWKICSVYQFSAIKKNETKQTHFKPSNKHLWKVEKSSPTLMMHPKWPRYTQKTANYCIMESWEDCIIFLCIVRVAHKSKLEWKLHVFQ